MFGLKPARAAGKARNRLKPISPVYVKVYGSAGAGSPPARQKVHSEVVRGDLSTDMTYSCRNSRLCKLDHNPCRGNGAVSPQEYFVGRLRQDRTRILYNKVRRKCRLSLIQTRSTCVNSDQYFKAFMVRMNRLGAASPGMGPAQAGDGFGLRRPVISRVP